MYRKSTRASNIEVGAEGQRIIARDTRVDNLPCQPDPLGYVRRQGRMEQQLTDIATDVERIKYILNNRREGPNRRWTDYKD
jgi:hypothetical protein